MHVYTLDGISCFQVSACHDDPGATSCQILCGLLANAAVGAGDDNSFSLHFSLQYI